MNDDLAIRAKPRPVRRFSKKVLIIGAAGLALLLSSALAFALQSPKAEIVKSTELYNTTHKPMHEALASLPKSYAEVTPISYPKLGPPLPGDLGAAYLGKGDTAADRVTDNPFKYEPQGQSKPVTIEQRPMPTYQPPRHTTPRQTQIDPAKVRQEEIRNASLFFDVGSNKAHVKSNELSGHDMLGDYDPLSSYQADMQAMTNMYASNMPGLPTGISPATASPPNPAQANGSDVYNKGQLQSPKSPYQVMAGTLIAASLVTGLNSDLPGHVIGQVTENVYDTVSGKHLLIPQGAKLIGSYESRNSYGDTRAFVNWSRLIFPNGNSITLDDLGAIDGQGFAGLKDKVNNHYGKLAGATVLSSVLGVGAELATDQDDRYVRAIQSSGQDSINMAGQRVIDRSINVEPTITIRPGWRFSVLVTRDLLLKPYSN